MGQNRQMEQALLSRPLPVTGDIQYPKSGDPGVNDNRGIDKILRGGMVGLGLEEQAPGDAAGAIGATVGSAASMLPIGKLLRLIKGKGMPNPVSGGLHLPREMAPMPTQNPVAEISRDEIDKMLHASVPRPHLETPHPGPAPLQTPQSIPQPPVGETDSQKMSRIMQERMQLRQEGRFPPRVPDPTKPKGM